MATRVWQIFVASVILVRLSPSAVGVDGMLPPIRYAQTPTGPSSRATMPAEQVPVPRQLPTGPISLDTRDLELTGVLELFRRQTGIQAVASPDAGKRRVTFRVDDRSPAVVLDMLTKANGLWFRQDPSTGVYYIYTEEERQQLPPDPKILESQINEAFPDSTVQLSLVGNKLIVRGEAKDVIEADQIIRLIAASAWSPQRENGDPNLNVNVNLSNTEPTDSVFGDGLNRTLSQLQSSQQTAIEDRIVNMLRIPGVQQVMLCVTVAEVNRSAGRSIGLNFNIASNGGDFVQSTVGGISTFPITPEGVASDTVRAVLDSGQLGLAIRALREMNLARTLAEPNLTALNGERARFQAGGQFPVPVVTGFTSGGLQGVDFVPFGVSLDFTPYILERDRIRLKVSAEVSDKSGQTNVGGGTNSESNQGTVVPGLQTRNFGTTVELRSGQTLAVAGLIQTRYVFDSKRIPFFGDLPVVGRLAGLDQTTSGETELVILVTPRLVQPIEQYESPPLPGSDVFEPGDVAFYLHGHLESRRSYDYRSSVRTDFHRQVQYEKCLDSYIIGRSGYCEMTPLPTPAR